MKMFIVFKQVSIFYTLVGQLRKVCFANKIMNNVLYLRCCRNNFVHISLQLVLSKETFIFCTFGVVVRYFWICRLFNYQYVFPLIMSCNIMKLKCVSTCCLCTICVCIFALMYTTIYHASCIYFFLQVCIFGCVHECVFLFYAYYYLDSLIEYCYYFLSFY